MDLIMTYTILHGLVLLDKKMTSSKSTPILLEAMVLKIYKNRCNTSTSKFTFTQRGMPYPTMLLLPPNVSR